MTLIPATCELWVNGAPYADGSTVNDDPVALSGLTVNWGRSNTLDQPSPSTCSFTIADPLGGTVRYDSTIALGSTIVVWSALEGHRSVVFAGRVSDLSVTFDDDAAELDVVATDLIADLANRFVGAEPWPLEVMWQRANRIVQAIGQPLSLIVSIGTRPAFIAVSRMDVDRQPATALLYELATSTGTVLRPTWNYSTNTPQIVFEDPVSRASLYQFLLNPDTGKWEPMAGVGSGSPMSACDVLRDPVAWSRNVTDLVTRTTVRWLDQSTSPGTTERSVVMVDTAAEAQYGSRGVSVGTILTTATDANTLASGVTASHQPAPTWRTAGLTWDLSETETPAAEAAALATKLLDNQTRGGLALSLQDLPDWTPTSAAASLYVEGGRYEFIEGRWVLALDCSPATGVGTSITFDQVNEAVRYVDVDRSVAYIDMIGVGP